MGLFLAAISMPYISENAVLGIIGVASGLLIALSAVRPLLAAARGRGKPGV